MKSKVPFLISLGFAFAVTWLWPKTGFGGDVENLYSATVPVPDRSQDKFEEAVGLALKAVLVKITGSAAGAGHAANVLVDGAVSLLEQYSYIGDEFQNLLYLSAKFDQSILNDELTTLEIPIWGKERPDTFIGLLSLDGSRVRWLSEGDESRVVEELFLVKAGQRGLPLIFPSAKGVVDLPVEPLLENTLELKQDLLYQEIVERFATPSVVLMSLRQVTSEIWEASWSLQLGNQKYKWNSEGDLLDLVVSRVVDVVSDKISSALVEPIVVREPGEIGIEILGLKRSADFLKVLDYFSTLDSVKSVSVKSVGAEKVVLSVSTVRSRRELLQSIAFGNFLNLVTDVPITYDLRVDN